MSVVVVYYYTMTVHQAACARFLAQYAEIFYGVRACLDRMTWLPRSFDRCVVLRPRQERLHRVKTRDWGPCASLYSFFGP